MGASQNTDYYGSISEVRWFKSAPLGIFFPFFLSFSPCLEQLPGTARR